MCLTISPELLCQIGRAMSHFVGAKPSMFAVFIGFSRRLNKKFGGKNFFITLRKEPNVLYFFEFLSEFLTKTSYDWLDLLVLRLYSLKWVVTILKIFFRTVIQR